MIHEEPVDGVSLFRSILPNQPWVEVLAIDGTLESRHLEYKHLEHPLCHLLRPSDETQVVTIGAKGPSLVQLMRALQAAVDEGFEDSQCVDMTEFVRRCKSWRSKRRFFPDGLTLNRDDMEEFVVIPSPPRAALAPMIAKLKWAEDATYGDFVDSQGFLSLWAPLSLLTAPRFTWRQRLDVDPSNWPKSWGRMWVSFGKYEQLVAYGAAEQLSQLLTAKDLPMPYLVEHSDHAAMEKALRLGLRYLHGDASDQEWVLEAQLLLVIREYPQVEWMLKGNCRSTVWDDFERLLAVMCPGLSKAAPHTLYALNVKLATYRPLLEDARHSHRNVSERVDWVIEKWAANGGGEHSEAVTALTTIASSKAIFAQGGAEGSGSKKQGFINYAQAQLSPRWLQMEEELRVVLRDGSKATDRVFKCAIEARQPLMHKLIVKRGCRLSGGIFDDMDSFRPMALQPVTRGIVCISLQEAGGVSLPLSAA